MQVAINSPDQQQLKTESELFKLSSSILSETKIPQTGFRKSTHFSFVQQSIYTALLRLNAPSSYSQKLSGLCFPNHSPKK